MMKMDKTLVNKTTLQSVWGTCIYSECVRFS